MDKKKELEEKLKSTTEQASAIKAELDRVKTEEKKEQRRKWREEQNRKIAELKERLGRESGLTDHPKFELLFNKAWEHGHSDGLSQVEWWFDNLAELLQ